MIPLPLRATIVTGSTVLHQNPSARPTAELRTIPSGTAGTRATLQIMRQLVRRYKKSVPVRQLALSIIDRVRGHKNFYDQVSAIHEYVKNNIQFVKDVNGIETLATPLKTIEYRKGDCDDQAVLIASLLESIGHPTRFIAVRPSVFGPYVHVYVETRIGSKWVPVETTEQWPMGKGPPLSMQRLVWNN